MKPNYLIALVFVMTLGACGDKESKSTVENSSESSKKSEEPVTAEEKAALDELSRPAKILPKPGSVEAFFVEAVKDLMVNGSKKFDKKRAILRILNDLDALGLTPQGRPEGLVRDVVERMMEDTESYRPPGFTADKLTEINETMLTRLGKSYLNDIKDALDPSRKDHKGSMRRVKEIDPARVLAGYQAITWKSISGFRFDEKAPMPQNVQDLDGKKVALMGFMYPMREYEDIHEFLLVESMWTCCFGGPPQVTQVVKVKLADEAPGLWVMTKPILVHGTFHVEVEKDEGWVIGVYRISADQVKEY